jgi:glycosyltransferase involved in cell wall biosynthesis
MRHHILLAAVKTQEMDGIHDFTQHLAEGLRQHEGVRADVINPKLTSLQALCELVESENQVVSTLMLQYNPFSFGRWGFAPWLPVKLWRLKRSAPGLTVALMVHETYLPITDWRSAVMGVWQRLQFWAVALLADVIFTSIGAWRERLDAQSASRPVHHLPVGSNLPDMRASRVETRRALGAQEDTLVLAAFGTGNPVRLMDYVVAATEELGASRGHTMLLNLGAGTPEITVSGTKVLTTGPMSDADVARHLAAADIFLSPFIDGVSTRRTTVMAALQHEVPIIGTDGPLTDTVMREAPDAMRLTPVGDRAAFARAARELAGDSHDLRVRGRAAKTLYDQEFSWPATSKRLIEALEAMTSAPDRRNSARRKHARSPDLRQPEVTIVAHDAGGVGGMERMLAELIAGLVDRGHRVTVISRTCAVAQHPSLRWVRVPGPRRPFVLAYPWFLAMGSALVYRQRAGTVISTGAIIANRCDWVTVHFCHQAAQRVGLRRSSRNTVAYQLNDRVSRVLSLWGEKLLYRPSRAQGLVGVSGGVSEELAEYYPRMSRKTIPNGVDITRFRPSSEKRTRVRRQLGIDDGDLVGVFVGSEWDRKGLRLIIDALVDAPEWRLVVVGAGDEKAFGQYATSRGVGGRVLFVGVVDEPSGLYCAGDVFVFPTAYETFSLVSYEAAASGLPLLVTPVNGVTDLLRNGVNGWTITRDPQDIAEKLSSLAASPALRARMGSVARQSVADFSWSSMVTRYQALVAQAGAPECAGDVFKPQARLAQRCKRFMP